MKLRGPAFLSTSIRVRTAPQLYRLMRARRRFAATGDLTLYIYCLCRAKVGRGLQGAGQRLLPVFRADLNAVGKDEFGILDADEAEHPA